MSYNMSHVQSQMDEREEVSRSRLSDYEALKSALAQVGWLVCGHGVSNCGKCGSIVVELAPHGRIPFAIGGKGG